MPLICPPFALFPLACASLFLCCGAMDIAPLELPLVVGREAVLAALLDGWPDMAIDIGQRRLRWRKLDGEKDY